MLPTRNKPRHQNDHTCSLRATHVNCFPPMSCYSTLAVGIDLMSDKGCAVIMNTDDHDPTHRETSQVLAGNWNISADCRRLQGEESVKN